MSDLIQIIGPTAEPVDLVEMLIQLGIDAPDDSVLNGAIGKQVTGLLLAARRSCESYTRSAYMTQTWELQLDRWPHYDHRYSHHHDDEGLPAILLPKPPFQSIAFVKYVDISGVLQTLSLDSSYGTDPDLPLFGFQLTNGTETKAAEIRPSWAPRRWPPTRRVANAVMAQFKCGFGGPVTVSMLDASAVLIGPVFNPGDVGQAVSVPGAVGSIVDPPVPPTTLNTTIASIDDAGQATLATAATSAVTGVTAYIGQPVPEEIRQAIKFLTQFFFEQGATVDLPTPRIVTTLLDHYRNLVA